MPSPLSDLAATLDELEPAAAMAEAARLALLQKETRALQEILRRVWLLMTLQDARKRESCYRREIALLEISERARGHDRWRSRSTGVQAMSERSCPSRMQPWVRLAPSPVVVYGSYIEILKKVP